MGFYPTSGSGGGGVSALHDHSGAANGPNLAKTVVTGLTEDLSASAFARVLGQVMAAIASPANRPVDVHVSEGEWHGLVHVALGATTPWTAPTNAKFTVGTGKAAYSVMMGTCLRGAVFSYARVYDATANATVHTTREDTNLTPGFINSGPTFPFNDAEGNTEFDVALVPIVAGHEVQLQITGNGAGLDGARRPAGSWAIIREVALPS